MSGWSRQRATRQPAYRSKDAPYWGTDIPRCSSQARDLASGLQAAAHERAAITAQRDAAEAEIEAEIDRRRARSEKAIQAIREEIFAKYGLTE